MIKDANGTPLKVGDVCRDTGYAKSKYEILTIYSNYMSAEVRSLPNGTPFEIGTSPDNRLTTLILENSTNNSGHEFIA